MSRAIALIKFSDGTILRGCYNGTSDFLSQWLITDKELEENYNGNCFSWDDEKWRNYKNEFIDSNLFTDLEDVEVFSDYGNGFSWKDKASKSKMVMSFETNIEYVALSNDIPCWVLDYFKNKGWDYKHLKR